MLWKGSIVQYLLRKEEDGYFKQHESLETARDYIIHEYGADVEIETETNIRFTY